MLALVMSGASPEQIGMEVWNDHPTLRALIKMVTSGRYRFPTIDCDEVHRSEMKAAEASMRDEVRYIPVQKVSCKNTAKANLGMLYCLLGISNSRSALSTSLAYSQEVGSE